MPADAKGSLLQTPRVPRIAQNRAGLVGALGGLALLGSLFAWALLTDIGGAVVTQGTVTVAGRPKAVQHLDGGIVAAILVADGDRVEAGQALLRLDATLLAANLEIYRNRLAEALARQGRLEAEQGGTTTIAFGPLNPHLAGRDPGPTQGRERAMFAAHLAIEKGRRAQIEGRIAQFANQIDGVEALVASKREQVRLIDREMVRKTTLFERGLTLEAEVLTLQGTRTDLLGQVAEHLSEIARIEGSVADAELEILQTSRQFQEAAMAELRDVSVTVEELTQQIRSTETQMARVVIVAPVAGRVHELQVVTVGGVVPPGATIAQIIAVEAAHAIEFRVPPTAIDQIHPGQAVRLHFSAFNQRSTPEIMGAVTGWSPTTVIDEATGAPFYRVAVDVSANELTRLGDLTLVPGMPVDGFIATGERSVASYLLKPFTDQLERAFREE